MGMKKARFQSRTSSKLKPPFYMWLRTGLLLLIFLFPVPGEAATWTAGLTHVPAAGANRLLVFISMNEDTTDRDITAVTYGGQNMTMAVFVKFRLKFDQQTLEERLLT